MFNVMSHIIKIDLWKISPKIKQKLKLQLTKPKIKCISCNTQIYNYTIQNNNMNYYR